MSYRVSVAPQGPRHLRRAGRLLGRRARARRRTTTGRDARRRRPGPHVHAAAADATAARAPGSRSWCRSRARCAGDAATAGCSTPPAGQRTLGSGRAARPAARAQRRGRPRRSPGWSTRRCSTRPGRWPPSNPTIDPGADGRTGRRRRPRPSAVHDRPAGAASPREGDRRPPRPPAPSRRRRPAPPRRLAGRSFRRQAVRHRSLAVPYGDLDVAAVLAPRRSAELYLQAADLSAATMTGLDVPVARRWSPRPAGTCRRTALRGSTPDTGAAHRPGRPDGRRAGARREPAAPRSCSATPRPAPADRRPDSRYAALAVRQRLLSEAAAARAVRRARRSRWSSPLRRTGTPGAAGAAPSSSPGSTSRWLHRGRPASRCPREPAPADQQPPLVYPGPSASAELPVPNLSRPTQLIPAGNVLAGLLSRNDTVDESSPGRRWRPPRRTRVRDPAARRAPRARSTTGAIRELLARSASRARRS